LGTLNNQRPNEFLNAYFKININSDQNKPIILTTQITAHVELRAIEINKAIERLYYVAK
jgi:hypothetical protein